MPCTSFSPVIPGVVPRKPSRRTTTFAEMEMQKVESKLVGIDHDAQVLQGMEIGAAIDQTIAKHHIDLIVLGTHGRTGTQKLLMGSVAEEIFRRSSVPVLTIGPHVRTSTHSPRFYRVLFATNFTSHSVPAASYAVSLAQENQARLILLHVMRKREPSNAAEESQFEMSVAEAIHQLYETVPKSVELGVSPEVAVEFGEPSERNPRGRPARRGCRPDRHGRPRRSRTSRRCRLIWENAPLPTRLSHTPGARCSYCSQLTVAKGIQELPDHRQRWRGTWFFSQLRQARVHPLRGGGFHSQLMVP